jgi:hypothetical protein
MTSKNWLWYNADLPCFSFIYFILFNKQRRYDSDYKATRKSLAVNAPQIGLA